MNPPNLQGSFTMTLTSKAGDTRVIKANAYQKKKDENRADRLFLFYLPPSVKGTGLLIHTYQDSAEDYIWIYLPAAGKVKRVNLDVSGGGNFMGSDFTYSDLVTPGSMEFNYTLQADSKVNGEDCYVIEVRGKTKEIELKYGYSKQLYYTRKSDFINVRIVFFDAAGDELKTLSVERVEVLGEYRYPASVKMQNTQTGHSSAIVFDKLETPKDIPDAYFTERYLSKQ
jgi:hypothetical protein